jgi:hypothetical protein
MVQRAVKPKGVMVWALVGHGVKGPLIFIPGGVKINSLEYREKVLEPLLEVLQLKWMPGHTNRMRDSPD